MTIALTRLDRGGGDVIAPPRPRISLRPYQEAGIAAVEAAEARGIRRPLLVYPTGAGKTIVFASLIVKRGGRALVLAHRDELIQQAADKIRLVSPTADIGIVKADDDEHRAPIVVASIQTLAQPHRLKRIAPDLTTIVVDEAHHANAASYRRVLDGLGSFDDRGPLTLGVTATPERGDGAGLGAVWQEIVYRVSILDLIRDGYLADLRAVQVRLTADFNRLKTRAGDFSGGELEDVLLDANAPEHAVLAYRQYAEGRKTIVFCPTVRTGQRMAEAFQRADIPAESLDGTMPRDTRRAILARFSRGETRIVTNCGVLTEGFDEPSVDCVIVARPTRSRPLYQQMIGRGMRLYPGKETCLIIDLVGASTRHDLATAASLFGLMPRDLAGQTVGQAVNRQRVPAMDDDTPAASGEMVARQVDLFRRRPLHWIPINSQQYLLPAGDDRYELRHDGDGWSVAHQHGTDTTPETVTSGLSLGYAQGVAEDLARAAGAPALTNPEAPWRNEPATDRQRKALYRLGVPIASGRKLTKSEASDLLSLAMAKGDRR